MPTDSRSPKATTKPSFFSRWEDAIKRMPLGAAPGPADKPAIVIADHIPDDEILVVPNLPRETGESDLAWSRRCMRGAVRFVNMGSAADAG